MILVDIGATLFNTNMSPVLLILQYTTYSAKKPRNPCNNIGIEVYDMGLSSGGGTEYAAYKRYVFCVDNSHGLAAKSASNQHWHASYVNSVASSPLTSKSLSLHNDNHQQVSASFAHCSVQVV